MVAHINAIPKIVGSVAARLSPFARAIITIIQKASIKRRKEIINNL